VVVNGNNVPPLQNPPKKDVSPSPLQTPPQNNTPRVNNTPPPVQNNPVDFTNFFGGKVEPKVEPKV
jgi:hypothetical protein